MPFERSESLPDRNLDEERLARFDEYFNVNLGNPNASKRELADAIGVCERQLTRILLDTYGCGFSEVLLHSRMTLAEARRVEGVLTSEEIAESVGYLSLFTFKRAYKRFFGMEFTV